MKKISLLSLLFAALVFVLPLHAQEDKGKDEKENTYEFEMIHDLPTTPVKNQYRAGTCWGYSGLALLESELLRLDKGEFDLSEMWVVRKAYEDKADKYVRMHGKTNFGGGGAFYDVLYVYKHYGMLPESEYKGLNYGTDNHVHGELDAVLNNFVDAVNKNKNKELTTAWKEAYHGILDAYLGIVPKAFDYEGKSYTPKTFADGLGLNMDDYINITSYTHHPFYEQFILEIPDNWQWTESWNLPMEDMLAVLDNAMKNGYTVAWGSDVSEKGFSWKNGVAIVPSEERPDLDGLEKDKWKNLDDKEKTKKLYSFEEILPEKDITQEMRQKAFNNYQTTDDHGMLISGKAKDQEGNIYYKVKISWDTDNIYDGYFFASRAFVSYKTMNLVVHKDAIPKHIRKKMGM
ncbi:MAG: aminopeptidase [Candidatus Delongbacteria bacterium]|jgi:bleomycin hydrolase|nr:aminopeptidase [Candidatus Delongbacteria bacterium]